MCGPRNSSRSAATRSGIYALRRDTVVDALNTIRRRTCRYSGNWLSWTWKTTANRDFNDEIGFSLFKWGDISGILRFHWYVYCKYSSRYIIMNATVFYLSIQILNLTILVFGIFYGTYCYSPHCCGFLYVKKYTLWANNVKWTL